VEPVSLLIVGAASLLAFGASALVKKFVRPRSGADDVVVVTSDGRKFTVKASDLTANKVEELTQPPSAATTATR